LPSTQNPSGALRARFGRQRVLIVGCGDVGTRAAAALPPRVRVLALARSPDAAQALRQRAIVPLAGDLDDPASLQRLAGIAHRVLHLAPPPGDGEGDPRTAALLRALARRSVPAALVYGSTSGVYGDCGGAWVDETRAVRPRTARARRRVAAEGRVRAFGRRRAGPAAIRRVPAFNAPARPGGPPADGLRRGRPGRGPGAAGSPTPTLAATLPGPGRRGVGPARPPRVVHVNDDSQLKMGDYFDLAADLYGLPRPSRIGRDAARAQLPATLLSFMGESRRMDNRRLKRELRLRLRHATPATGLLSTQ